MLSFSKDRVPALEEADLNETVGEVVELMQSRAQELGVSLVWEPAADLPSLAIDPEGIHRAVLNLVTNALDACEGVVSARVVVATAWDSEAATAHVTVSDNGAGIAPEDLPAIFHIFASTKGTRGTGLGLPVSEKIVREHGGRIGVVSEVGRGTRFDVSLPRHALDDPNDAADPSAPDAFETQS
jgi:signal transduction histidine kinase